MLSGCRSSKLLLLVGAAVWLSACDSQPADVPADKTQRNPVALLQNAQADSADRLPIRTGYYAVNEADCAAAMQSDLAGVMIEDEHLRDIDADYPLRPIRSLGENRYAMGEAWEMIRVTGPDTFIADEGTEHERRYLWCAAQAPE